MLHAGELLVATLTGYGKAFFDETLLTSLRSAREIVPYLVKLLNPKSVVDVGCGTGSWLSVFHQSGVEDIHGVDNAGLDNAQMQIPLDKVFRHDLTKPFQIGRKFELATCLEVAEHLPDECSHQIVENLTKLAPMVLFSAAIPHQGGTNHINEQWAEYWVERFAARGYTVVDCVRQEFWNNENVAYWYAQNLLLYVENSYLATQPQLLEFARKTDQSRVTHVHPKAYVKNSRNLSKPQFMIMRIVWNMIPRGLRLRLVKPLDSFIWRQVSTKYIED